MSFLALSRDHERGREDIIDPHTCNKSEKKEKLFETRLLFWLQEGA